MRKKAIEEHENQLLQSNELIKKDFNIERHGIPLEEKKKLKALVKDRAFEFKNLEKKSYSS